MVDPFACALNGIEVLDVGLGDTVVIMGAGPIGCWQSVMARDRGAGKVFLCDVSRSRLDLALQAVGGFVDDAWVVGEDAAQGVAEVLSRTGGAGAERVSVAAPSKQAQQAALEAAGKRARVVYFAGLPKHDPVSPLDMNQLHYKELAILGAYEPPAASTGSPWTTSTAGGTSWRPSSPTGSHWTGSARRSRRSVPARA